MTPKDRSRLIKERSIALGFDAVGITDLAPTPHAKALTSWLSRGFAGSMQYLERQAPKRLDPSTIVPGSTHAVVLTAGYYSADPPRPHGAGKVARYARGRDYHEALRDRLETLSGFIRSLGDDRTIAKPYVDAGPVPERELAQRSGLGWIGKNTMLIDPARGSFFFLASVLTNLPLQVDAPFTSDRCGTCTRCIDACPTGAFPESRVLDSRRCLSYLTIEHRGEFGADEEALIEDWVFGCDVCQEVCPWNGKFATSSDDDDLAMTQDLAFLNIEELTAIDEATFNERLGWTPMERAGVVGMRRNAKAVRGERP